MPKSGDVISSVQLKDAMEHYGADAPYHYLVAVRMFDSDGALMEDRASLEAEAARLAELGYVGTAVEQVIDYPPYLVLNVTYEQIAAFQGKEGYGYFLHLRDEGSWSIAVS
jgi:hypothetical protein